MRQTARRKWRLVKYRKNPTRLKKYWREEWNRLPDYVEHFSYGDGKASLRDPEHIHLILPNGYRRKRDYPKLIVAGELHGFSFVGVSIVDGELIGRWRKKDAADTCIRYKSQIDREEETINRRRVKAKARGERKSLQLRTRGAGYKWSSYIFEHEFTRREWDKKYEASLLTSVGSSKSGSASS